MPQAVLRTERIVLEPLAEDHLDDEVALDADPKVMRYLGSGRPRSRAEVAELHTRRLAVSALVPGLGFWAGRVDGVFVGWWILEPVVGENDHVVPGRAELGYRLHPCYWRHGLASEGARELLRHGFDDLGLASVIAQTMAVNAASRATMRSVGLRHVRTVHVASDDPIPGIELGEVEYELTRNEWLSLSR